MSRWRAVVAAGVVAGVVALGLSTAAASIGAAKIPPGWTLDEPTSLRASAATQAQYRSRGRAAQVEVEGHLAPSGPASLYVTRVREELAVEQPDGAGGAGLAQRRSEIVSEKLASLTRTAADSQGQVESSTQRWIVDDKLVEGTIRWKARDTGLRVTVRTLVAANAAGLSSITGECFLGVDASAALDQACQQALASLSLDLPVAERIEIALDAAPAVASPPAVVDIETAPAPATSDAPRLGEGPPGTVMRMSPSERERDRRPVYIGAGIVVMAAVFWWNRRRRERFERDDEQPRDDDADDLAAAARGDEKDSP